MKFTIMSGRPLKLTANCWPRMARGCQVRSR
jgi:hypothetical protein